MEVESRELEGLAAHVDGVQAGGVNPDLDVVPGVADLRRHRVVVVDGQVLAEVDGRRGDVDGRLEGQVSGGCNRLPAVNADLPESRVGIPGVVAPLARARRLRGCREDERRGGLDEPPRRDLADDIRALREEPEPVLSQSVGQGGPRDQSARIDQLDSNARDAPPVRLVDDPARDGSGEPRHLGPALEGPVVERSVVQHGGADTDFSRDPRAVQDGPLLECLAARHGRPTCGSRVTATWMKQAPVHEFRSPSMGNVRLMY